jgi:DNA sulfur modification protein DndD
MIFTELTLENFGPYRGKQTINLRPENQNYNSPIILLGGMNGGGKTTLMDAIRLALYGNRAQCSARGNLNYADFLIQSIHQQTPPNEHTRIELSFEHIVNEQWVNLKIVRYWNKNLKDGRDTLGIIDGDWPNRALANTWDEYIENILPLGISNLFLFDGEQVKELAEEELPTAPVVEAIKSLLGLELADRLAVDLDVFLLRKRKELASDSEKKSFAKIENHLAELNQTRDLIFQELITCQNELKQAQTNFNKASSNFRLEGGKIAAQRQHLQNQTNQYKDQIAELKLELIKLASSSLPLLLVFDFLPQIKLQGEQELKYQQAKMAYSLIQEREVKLFNFLNNLSIDSEKLSQIKNFLEQENKAFNEEAESISFYLESNPKTLQKLNHLLEYLLPSQKQKWQEISGKIAQLEKDLEISERQLAIAASPEAYEQLEQNLKETQQKLVKAKTNYETKQKEFNLVEKKIKEAKKQLAQYSQQALDTQNSQHLFQSITKVQQTLQLFQQRLTLKKLNKLELEVTDCFRYLLHKSNLIHKVAINADNFEISLSDSQGIFVPKNRLSAGEKQLLAISLLWGLARVSGKNLPIAIDTPLGRLDSSHRNNLVERYFPTASHQVVLLSTDTEIGKQEVQQLRNQEAIAREYLLKYNSELNQTYIQDGYFW